MSRILMFVAVLALAWPLQAQEVELREDHPREYVVQPGDTLWDISARFLIRPWQWPAIWQANPQIDNPHLIFPGDVISLVYIDGEPRLMVDETRRLSPAVRREPLDGPITTIPLDAIQEFLRYPRILSQDEFDQLPYVVANEEQRFYAGPTDRVYVRGLEDSRQGDEVVIAQVNFVFHDKSREDGDDRHFRRSRVLTRRGQQVPTADRPPTRAWRVVSDFRWAEWPIVGYELWEAARAVVVKPGDPAILELHEGRREVRAGDYVLPVDTHIYDPYFEPRAMDEVPENARVLALSEAYHGAGHYQIVALNIGSEDGVQPGHTFAGFTPGEVIRDEHRYPRYSRAAREAKDRRYVELPATHSGQIMVFRAFDRISYGIVLGGQREVRRNDILRHPDERL